MSKTFKTAKKPPALSPDKIAAFESGGIGHDHKTTNVDSPKSTFDGSHNPVNVASRNTTNQQTHIEPTKRLSIDLPESVHRRFKTACSASDLKMASELSSFIECRTVELEQQAGITHKST